MEVKDIIERFKKIESERYNWENQWKEAARFCLPAQHRSMSGAAKGTAVDPDVYDSTARRANQIFAAGLHGYLTNPSSPWFSLEIKDDNLKTSYQVQDWLKECERRIRARMNGSNFHTAVHELYLAFGAYGTPTMYVSEDMIDVVRYYTRKVTEMYPVENERESIDTMYRPFTYTARQAYRIWGEQAGEVVRKALGRNEHEKEIEFWHVVLPREDHDPRKMGNRNMPFASLWIEPTQKRVLSEGGYHEFPFMTPRFGKLPGQAYGYGPGMIALPDIRMANAMKKTLLKAGHKAVDPPKVLPDDGFLLPFKDYAGAINFKTAGSQDRIDVLNFTGGIPYGKDEYDECRQAIQQTFFADMFLLLGRLDKTMTAREVSARVTERMLILGPVLGRMMDELLNPLIERTFSIMLRQGLLPPVPEVLVGRDYEIEYISPLARAQKLAEEQNVHGMLGVVAEMAQIMPEVVDRLDGDQVVKDIAGMHNAQNLLRSDEEVEQIRGQRAQAQQARMALEMANQGGEAAKKIAEAQRG